jgi:flagellar hook-length control protein FliK
MDNNVIASLMGQTSPTLEAEKGRQKQPVDEETASEKSFALFLEQEDEKSDVNERKYHIESTLIDDNPEEQGVIAGRKQAEKSGEKAEAAAQDKIVDDAQKQFHQKMSKMSPMLNYIYNLMYKDPKAMTMVEKKSAGLDKHELFKLYDVEYGDFKNMLTKRGLTLADLTFDQMSKLARIKTDSGVEAFLSQIAKAKKETQVTEVEKKTLVEQGMEAAAKQKVDGAKPVDAPPMQNLREALGTERSGAQSAETAQKRQEVMDQIIKNIDIRNFRDKSEMVIKLNPEYLGELKMLITKDDNRMTAHFETTSRDVREIISGSLDEFTEMFKKKGMKISSARVSLVDEIE